MVKESLKKKVRIAFAGNKTLQLQDKRRGRKIAKRMEGKNSLKDDWLGSVILKGD